MTTRVAIAGKAQLINTKGGARTIVKARFIDNGEQITLWGSATDIKMLAVSNGEKIIVDVIQPHPMKVGGTVTYKFKSTKIAADLAAQSSFSREMLTPGEEIWQIDANEFWAERAAILGGH